LREGDAVRRLFEEEEFDGVIHCAALSRGRECEADPEGAFTANVEVPRGIVAALQGLGREPELLSLSTDLVFEGRVAPRGGFSEEDDTAPVTVYAKTKRLGEEAVLGYARGSVLRLSLVYGARIGASAGFLEWIFRGVESGRSVPLFTDEYRTPVCVHDISEVCRLILCHPAPPRGVLHVGGSERLSRYEFGVKLASVFGFEERLLLPVSRLSGLGDGGFRAEDVSLSVERLRSVLGFVPCDGFGDRRVSIEGAF
jgi:dTDP-4-dehydrorhamnose reductase